MAKLGYTWYPKDWTSSESVFELDLTQRGLYRELIDLAMLNDNKTVINESVWSRKWDIDLIELNSLLSGLKSLKLIEIDNKNLFIPSCESRLNMMSGCVKGGKKSKPTNKGSGKPNSKGDSNQKKLKEKERKEIDFNLFWTKYPNKVGKSNCEKIFKKLSDLDIQKILSTIDSFILYKPFKDYTHPNPQTYLNGKRWNDEFSTLKPEKKTNEQLQYEYIMNQIEKNKDHDIKEG